MNGSRPNKRSTRILSSGDGREPGPDTPGTCACVGFRVNTLDPILAFARSNVPKLPGPLLHHVGCQAGGHPFSKRVSFAKQVRKVTLLLSQLRLAFLIATNRSDIGDRQGDQETEDEKSTSLAHRVW